MRFSRVFGFLVLAAAVSLPAMAQTSGVFRLASDTTWNGSTVPAGEYTISQWSDNPAVVTLRAQNANVTTMFLVPVSRDYSAACKTGSVQMVRSGASFAVKSVCLADEGVTYYFTARSADREVASAAKPSHPAIGR